MMFMLSPNLGFWILLSLSVWPLEKHSLVLVLSAAQSGREPKCIEMWAQLTARLGSVLLAQAGDIQWHPKDLMACFRSLCLTQLCYWGWQLGSQACWGVHPIHTAWNKHIFRKVLGFKFCLSQAHMYHWGIPSPLDTSPVCPFHLGWFNISSFKTIWRRQFSRLVGMDKWV